tara:strand:- start:56 stop:1066 length:1011 start_codon:yes stop_codon:yes gene_type:complete
MYRFSKPALFILLFAFQYSTVALDFAKLRLDIINQESRLRSIEANRGYLSPELIEPLDTLVKLSLLANRLSDADVYIDRALQIVRLEEGLYNPKQYPFLKSAIEVEIDQGNWKDAKEKLNFLKWLVDKKYEGPALDRVSLLHWIVGTHMRGFYEDSEESEAEHLINATRISETAVMYSQANGLVEGLTYLDLLVTLSNSYMLEVEGIRGGGSTSYRIRRLGPSELNIFEKRSEAEEKRYSVGLEKLNMIRELSSKFFNNALEAKSMADLYIARWQDYFDRVEEHEFSISRARDGLIKVGYAPSEVDRLLNDLSILPAGNMLLTFSEVEAVTAGAGD